MCLRLLLKGGYAVLRTFQNKMAAIIRVKRRLDEDPAESLIVQYKKRRSDGTAAEETAKFCLNLVTTVKTKVFALIF